MKKILGKLNPKRLVDALLRRKIATAFVTIALGIVANHLSGHSIEVSNDVENALIVVVDFILATIQGAL